MVTKIQKWGNSQGLRTSRHLLESASLSVGDEVAVDVRDSNCPLLPKHINLTQ